EKARPSSRSRNWDACTLFDVNFKPTHLIPDELRVGFRELVVKLYSDEFTQRRRSNFKKQIREKYREERLTA
ncbi:MAG: hypothetical protein IID32_07490, partial [Planctomycetes bacterium]|nr:hypothetical protein [Planctomycetota bacterium]